MCIRDSSKVDASHVAVVFDHPEADNYRLKSSEYKSDRVQDFSDELDSPFHHLDNLKLVLKYVGVRYIAVSYTHLTLPTSDLV